MPRRFIWCTVAKTIQMRYDAFCHGPSGTDVRYLRKERLASMRKFRTAAALALCAVCLLQTAAPVLAAEDYPAPDVSGKTVEELIDAFRAEHGLTEDNFELSYYNTVTGESYDFNETKMLYGASTYKLPLNLYYYDMQLAGEITGDTMITKGSTLDEAHYQSLVYSNNELSYSLWRRIGDWPEYKQAMRKYFTMTDEEIPQNYYYDHLFCTRMMMDTLKVVWDGQENYTELIDDLKIACPDAYFKTYIDVDETPIAHKYGSYNGAENDVGIIWAAQPFLLAVYTSGLSYGAGGNVDNAYADGQSAGSVICGQFCSRPMWKNRRGWHRSRRKRKRRPPASPRNRQRPRRKNRRGSPKNRRPRRKPPRKRPGRPSSSGRRRSSSGWPKSRRPRKKPRRNRPGRPRTGSSCCASAGSVYSPSSSSPWPSC